MRDTASAPVSMAGDIEPVLKTTRCTWKAYAATATSTQMTPATAPTVSSTSASRARRAVRLGAIGTAGRSVAASSGDTCASDLSTAVT